jgi:hypothetical protein
MNGSAARLSRFAAGLLLLVTLGWVLTGQAAKPAHHRVSLVTDWSHRHLIFSQPRTAEQAARLQQDPRFEQQMSRRSQRLVLANGGEAESTIRSDARSHPHKHFPLRRDWSADLGAGGSVRAGFFPAKFSFDIEHASCPNDFVVFTTGLPGASPGQATIVAYNNLYSGCGGAVPSVYWAYNTQGVAVTSPVFSKDGSQIAFVETQFGVAGELVLMKWTPSAPGTSVSVPAGIPFFTPANYHACPAPCFTTVDLHDTSTFFADTTSSVFYDYTNDIAWVGGATGWLVKITPVFNGTPAEVQNATWPKQVNPSSPKALTSPVFDHNSGNVLVGDAGGFLYSVNSTNGAVTKSGQLDFGAGLVETPILDQSNQVVYVFASSDGTNNVCDPTAACAAVYQLPTSFAATSTGTKVTVGTSVVLGGTPNPMYTGGFDNAYFSSFDGTGNLYVCGNTGAEPTLYQIPIVAHAFTAGAGASITKLGLAGQTPGCSPITDILNPNDSAGPTERFFVGVTDKGISTPCAAAGCVFNFISTPWQPATVYAVGQEILDSNLRIEVVTSAGTSGAIAPTWGNSSGTARADGSDGLTWLNQGLLTADTLPGWQANTAYASGARVPDTNGNLEVIGLVGTPGTSDLTTQPTWNGTVGGFTPDGSVIWVNAGPLPTSALAASGGTSGMIMDNVVSPTTLLGVSQIYFSTLGDQACTDGTGGCAVQASQPGLK